MKLWLVKDPPRFGSNCGYTIVETAIAGCILAVFLTGLYDANWWALSLMKSGREGTSAARLIQNRLEQIRTSTWSEITNPAYVSGTMMATTSASNDLDNLVETVSVNQYPLPTGYTQGGPLPASGIQVTRSAAGAVTTLQSGNSTLASDSAIRVDITEKWSATLASTSDTRMMSTVITQGGILGRNQ